MTTAVSEKLTGAVAALSLRQSEILGGGGVMAVLQEMREAENAYTAFRKQLADIQATEARLTEVTKRFGSSPFLQHQPPQAKSPLPAPRPEPPQAKSPISESLSAPPEPLFLIDGKAVSEAEYQDWAVSEHYRKIGQKGNYTRGEVKRQIVADFIQEYRETGISKNQFAAKHHKHYCRSPATIRNILKKVTV